MSAPTADLLSLIADDKSVVSYRPRWNQLTGSITATILLQQLIYRWIQSGRRPFYKFTGPCAHPLCRPGDTWEEELGLTRRQFETARAGIATRTQGDIADDTLVSYWMTTGHCTWYAINEPLLIERLAALYPADEAAAVGVQLRLPSPKPFDISANGDGGNAEWRSTNPPMAMAEMSNGVSGNGKRPAEPFDKSANAIGGIRQQINKDDLIDHEEQRPTETTSPAPAAPTPPAADPPAPAAAAADPLQPILDWIGFDDTLNGKERQRLDQATLLAWAYTVKLNQTLPRARGSIFNPVGLVRSLWRHGQPPRADLLNLARQWLSYSDDDRARLLGRLEWTTDYDAYDPTTDPDQEFPAFPWRAAAAVHTATRGELGPPSLMPPPAPPPDPRQPRPAARVAPQPPVHKPDPAAADLWREALPELEMQMTRATFTTWLQGTTATLTDDGDQLTIHVRNHYAIDWLQNRLHDLITRTVGRIAGRPITVLYEVFQPEAQHG